MIKRLFRIMLLAGITITFTPLQVLSMQDEYAFENHPKNAISVHHFKSSKEDGWYATEFPEGAEYKGIKHVDIGRIAMKGEGDYIEEQFRKCPACKLIREDMESPNYVSLEETYKKYQTSFNKKKEFCSHWGLSHWISGIGEYFSRCLCCSTVDNYFCDDEYRERQFFVASPGGHNPSYSNCFCVDQSHHADNLCCLPNGGLCDNPISGTIFCPIVTIGHLLSVPFVLLCCSSEDSCCSKQKSERYHPYIPPAIPWYERSDASTESLVREAARQQLRK